MNFPIDYYLLLKSGKFHSALPIHASQTLVPLDGFHFESVGIRPLALSRMQGKQQIIIIFCNLQYNSVHNKIQIIIP